jgi:hypothetical protein
VRASTELLEATVPTPAAATLRAESNFDARGSLGVARDVHVGIGEVTVPSISTPTPVLKKSTGWPP